MEQFTKHYLFPITVFITGACVLIIEIVAVRALSPYWGNTIFTVSSVISVILAALSLGYWIGGKTADRHPSSQWFFTIIVISGTIVLILHFLGMFMLPLLSVVFSITTGPLIASLIFFLIPALLLGTLSPYAIKLQSIQTPEQGIGTISGTIFFWSTLGSITGSLLAGFVLIPRIGVDQIFIATGATLFLLGGMPLMFFLGTNKKRLVQLLWIAIIVTSASIVTIQQLEGKVVYRSDGIYEKIIIHDGTFNDRPTRFFQQDRSASGAMFLDTDDPTDLVYGYTKYYSLYKIFKPDVQNALVIGGGAYSIPKALLVELPNATIDVSEIEPSLFDLAKQYFKVEENPNLHNYTEDGRRLLRDSEKKYDMIFSDVYYSLFSIPMHFTTREFFALTKERLTDKGIFIANVIGDLSQNKASFVLTEIKTFQSVFSNSYFFAMENPKGNSVQNLIFVGYNSDKKIDMETNEISQHNHPIIRSLKETIIHVDEYDLSPYPILTDNFAPVEYLISKSLQRTYDK